MKASEVLLQARELIAASGGWTQGWLAKDSDGLPATTRDNRARCFCLLGAIDRSEGAQESKAAWFLCSALGLPSVAFIAPYNDDPNRTQLECVVALEMAAVLALEADQ